MNSILFLHDTNINTPRGAELTIKELIELGENKGFSISTNLLTHFESAKNEIVNSDLVVLNSTSRCNFEFELLEFLIVSSTTYIKVEYDYNFCVRRNILCTVDRNVQSCCNTDKFHLYRKLFAQSELNIFQSPKHYEAHFDFYGEAVAKHLIMPPTVQIEHLKPSTFKQDHTIPFFGDLNYLKGGNAYIDYALEHPKLNFTVYGTNRIRREIPENISFHNPVANTEVLEILGKTKQFICQPVWPEPSGRLAAEAFLSGCEMITNDRIGTFSFEFYPHDKEQAIKEIKQAPENFWNAIQEILVAKKTVEKQKKLGKVLVYKSYGGLGDIFFAIPAINKIAEVSEKVDFAVAPRLVPFFKKYVEKVTVVDETEARNRENNYDNVYELGNYPAFRGYDLPHALKYPTHKKVKQHAIQHYIDTVSKLHKRIDNHLEVYPYFERNPNPKEKYFVVHHGAGFLLKIWPTEKYAALIERLHEMYPHLKCKIIQGPDDPDIKSCFSKEMNHVDYVTGGMEDVGEAMAGALFHIGNDAGITHVAGAFNVPSVGIYGPTGPGSWGSFAKHNELIWGKQGVCNIRCNYDVILNCEHRICLNSVTVERVLEALYKLLQKAYPSAEKSLRANPMLDVQFGKNDCILNLGGNEFLIEYQDDKMKNQLELLFENPINIDAANQDLQLAISLFIQQNILFEIPEFN